MEVQVPLSTSPLTPDPRPSLVAFVALCSFSIAVNRLVALLAIALCKHKSTRCEEQCSSLNSLIQL